MNGVSFNHTEPMNLGSPPSSNNSPGAYQYLPGFLMNENPLVVNPVATNPFTESKVSRQNPVSPLCGNSHNMPVPLHSGNKLQPRCLSQTGESVGRRLTSPPTRSMWSTVSGTGVRANNTVDSLGGLKHSTPNYSTGASVNPSVKRLGVASPFQSPAEPSYHRNPLHNIVNKTTPLIGSPLHNNSVVLNPNDGNANKQDGLLTPDRLAEALFTHQSSNDIDSANPNDCWVTVFGFPPPRAAFILNQFAQLGTIEKHVITNSGNWMHIKYQNRMQARCALNKNGKVFGDNIMVGVSVCTDPQVMNGETSGLFCKQTNTSNINDSIFLSPSNHVRRGVDENNQAIGTVNKTPLRDLGGLRSNVGDNSTNIGTDSNHTFSERPVGNIGRHNSMRSLAASTRPTNLSRTTSVRQDKDSGLLSKALGYMFGWS
ncbi:unnamed protein product [Heterobilharzia americana]|nr:unnamed protein product [Heterobilharzia americana]CAH8534862.1 unnamed protein product [Heterobilharzia americana]CAH8560828.1 unnamed protein product [Heterobilharzia americana]